MGLPDGWVTGVPGLSRNQQLTLLGNGVVPAQGAAALTVLVDRLVPIGPATTQLDSFTLPTPREGTAA